MEEAGHWPRRRLRRLLRLCLNSGRRTAWQPFPLWAHACESAKTWRAKLRKNRLWRKADISQSHFLSLPRPQEIEKDMLYGLICS